MGEEDEGEGTWAVPGERSHEHPDVLSPDEKGEEDEPVPPPSEPQQPSP